ncbi:MAG TPA: hypothetical protein VFC70_03265 [Oscillospiraceae bacterium]|nr:hypothetical protein [Oscillospiraceae bacterium]
MRKISNSSVSKALERMKLEIADEFDANIIGDEKNDGTMVENLIHRAEEKIAMISELEEEL